MLLLFAARESQTLGSILAFGNAELIFCQFTVLYPCLPEFVQNGQNSGNNGQLAKTCNLPALGICRIRVKA